MPFVVARTAAKHGASLALAGALAACAWGEVGLPPVEEQIAVQALLDAGASRQVIWIHRGVGPGEPLPYPPRPLAAPPSRIEVREVGGPVHAFRADPADSTLFVADFTPAPGGHYELLVEATGRTIRGVTVVPGAVFIVDPATDTVDLSTTDLRLAWRAESARDFAWFASPVDTSAVHPAFPPHTTWVGSDTTATLPVAPPAEWWPPLTVVWLMALDAASGRLFDSRRRATDNEGFVSNLDGGIGVFGAMTWDRVYVRVAR